MSDCAIPPVSYRRFAEDDCGFAADLGKSLAHYGFAVISDHPLDPELIAAAQEDMRAVFALPETDKRRFISGQGGQRGYVPFGIETAKGAAVADLKEFWHVGRDLPEGHRFRDVMPENVWPEVPARFRPTMSALFAAFDAFGTQILQAIALYLGLPKTQFQNAIADGNSILRLLHYPPLEPQAGGVRAAAHEDINAITLLLGAEEAGLEILSREGRWIPIQPPPGALVCNIGDMLQRATNHRLPSTTHRVVNPPQAQRDRPRYSMPFFLHFAPDFEIRTLPGCAGPDRPNRYPEPISAEAYLRQRLAEIKLL